MKQGTLIAVALVALMQYASAADILKGMLKSGDDSKCLGIDTDNPAVKDSTTAANCILVTLMDAASGGGYIISYADDKKLNVAKTNEAVATFGATGTAFKLVVGSTTLSGFTSADVSSLTNKDAAFRISDQTGTDGKTECLSDELKYISSDTTTACDGKTWYFNLEDCTDSNCKMCNLGKAMCTGCNDMYVLKADKTCTACTDANANCNKCTYTTAATPVLECTGCKADYELKEKACVKKDDKDNSGFVLVASPLVVMVTVLLGVLQIRN